VKNVLIQLQHALKHSKKLPKPNVMHPIVLFQGAVHVHAAQLSRNQSPKLRMKF
jgi:hypothetical protein